ncbi:LysR substrate-binding domain-containing protein [Streptomyces eurythermus]|uniref:LysR substrate-binding domain-containing protein n=1 Tax=Streptomyces eurythermus TaxID=42237 RepID=UPI0036806AA4
MANDPASMPADITTEHSATTLIRMLSAGKYDAILYGEAGDYEVPIPDGVSARTLIPKEPACVRLSATHPLAGQEQIELADLAGETWTTLTDDGDGGPEAMTDACRRAGFMPTLRYRIADRKMRWERIAAGRAISLCRPTSPHAEGTVPRPPAGDPITDASGSRGTGPRSPNGAPACCTGLRHGRTSTASPTTPSTARGGTPVRNCTRSSTERTRGLRRGRAFTVWSGGARRFRPSGEVAGTRSSRDSP